MCVRRVTELPTSMATTVCTLPLAEIIAMIDSLGELQATDDQPDAQTERGYSRLFHVLLRPSSPRPIKAALLHGRTTSL